MGASEQSTGDKGRDRLVRLLGYNESLSLDDRGRFRLPDQMANALQREMGRVSDSSSPAPYERLALYFVPGTRERIFLYPAPNIQLAIDRFENPPPGMEPDVIRRARDYFYYRMRFVEADKQNRFLIPEGLREHAGIDEEVEQITVVAHNHWLSLSRSDREEQRAMENLEAFESAAPDLLNPVYPTPPLPTEAAPEGDEHP